MPTHIPRRRLLAALGSIPLASLPSLAWSQAVHSAPTIGSTATTTASSAQSAIYSEADIAYAQCLRDAGLKSGLAYTLVESLTTEVGARPAGSANDARAVAWAQAAMRQLGLSNVRAEPVPLSVWQRGPLNAQLLAPHAHPLVATALGNSVSTPPGGLEAEVAYYADLAALRADTSERARGKLVFIDEKTERSRDGRGYGRAVLARSAGAVEAARRGAVAVAIRSIGTDRDRLAHTGALRYDPLVAQIPAMAVSVPDADLIARLHTRGQPMRLKLRWSNRSRRSAPQRAISPGPWMTAMILASLSNRLAIWTAMALLIWRSEPALMMTAGLTGGRYTSCF